MADIPIQKARYAIRLRVHASSEILYQIFYCFKLVISYEKNVWIKSCWNCRRATEGQISAETTFAELQTCITNYTCMQTLQTHNL